ncbi:beta-lactamase family protein [Periconia macrospinosa]|uniref:Beta-lactamase family protein n=1 Tax=Periconia macrospinosa TaxID=97972 RepID=A0A2V1EC61_9PLEO|nr:beta-lactamase family protein [Periconia macrospinosa]
MALPKPLSEAAKADLRSYIESFTEGDTPKLPGVLTQIIDTNSNELFSHATAASCTQQSISPNESFIITHSMSKAIGAIAFLQLVDQGLVNLDDARVIEEKLPELASKKILKGVKELENGEKEWLFEDRKEDITPRMLLSHSWGGGHSFFNALLGDYLNRPERGVTQMECSEGNDWWRAIQDCPLLYQPGTKAQYSHGPNWIAVLHERITGKSLDRYMHENMFQKMGLQKIGYEGQYGGEVAAKKPGETEGQLWRYTIPHEGKFVLFPGFPHTWLDKVERADAFPAGKHHWFPSDTGIVTTVVDLARLMSILALQNGGVDPVTGNRILSAEAAKEITSPQLPESIRKTGRNIFSDSIPHIIRPLNLEAEHKDPGGCFGLGGNVQARDRVLESGKRGRSKGSFYWYGATNGEYWVDSEKGIIVVLSANCGPWNLDEWLELVSGVEERLYAALEGA